MSDRCSCVDGPTYRCGMGRPCDVHGSVDALMAWGEYVDRRGRTWRQAQGFILPDGTIPWALRGRGITVTPAQMRRRIEREQHRDMCPGLDSCGTHPAVTVAKGALGGWVAFPPHYDAGRAHTTFAEAIDAAQRLATETM